MKEVAYNLFLFVENDVIEELGIVVHELDGTDDQKVSVLQSSVNTDYVAATRYGIDGGLPYQEYQSKERLGRRMEIFESILTRYNAPINPLVVVTPIVGSFPRIDLVTGMGALDLNELDDTSMGESGTMVDYLNAYIRNGQFDLPQLIEDDYFKAIKVVYNAGRYVSATKLLLSFLDTVAFIEFGDVQNNFAQWLSTYADLDCVGINAQELWEFRNALLHMTNAHSRRVIAGKTPRLVFYVGEIPQSVHLNTESVKYFDLKALLGEVVVAVSKWIETYNCDRSKFESFVGRYDLILSDSRLAYFTDAG